jgi:hypothetical protein
MNQQNADLNLFTQETLDEYAQRWGAESALTPGELDELAKEELVYSGDLKEATYNIPFDVMNANCEEVFSTVMQDFKPYQVFEEVWTTHSRTVFMETLHEKGFWHGEDLYETKNGSFMGDALSFIHLVLWLMGCVRAAHVVTEQSRPLGQNIGDDLITLKSKLDFIMAFCKLLEGVGGKFSPLNSVCEDAGTFCENYFAKVTNRLELEGLGAYEKSQFGDIFFLDIIKGSLLGGQTKVRANGSDPFMGHATMLSTQLGWHPSTLVKKRAPKFLWATHYNAATKLTASMVTLPRMLGGMALGIREPMVDSDQWWQDHCGYYNTMCCQDLHVFVKWYVFLQGIFLSNPKGNRWSNTYDLVNEICMQVNFHHEESLHKLAPEWLRQDRDFAKCTAWAKKNLNFIRLDELAAQIARREAFLKQWKMEEHAEHVNLTPKNVSGRQNYVWGKIKTELYPIELADCKFKTIKSVENAFKQKAFGIYVCRDDPVIQEKLCFMPSLFDDFGQYEYIQSPISGQWTRREA